MCTGIVLHRRKTRGERRRRAMLEKKRGRGMIRKVMLGVVGESEVGAGRGGILEIVIGGGIGVGVEGEIEEAVVAGGRGAGVVSEGGGGEEMKVMMTIRVIRGRGVIDDEVLAGGGGPCIIEDDDDHEEKNNPLHIFLYADDPFNSLWWLLDESSAIERSTPSS